MPDDAPSRGAGRRRTDAAWAPKARFSRVALLLCAAAALAPASCGGRRSVDWQGERKILSTYSGGRLYADLPRGVTTHAIMAAGESALAHRGYTIARREATADRAVLVALPPDPRLGQRVTNRGRVLREGATLEIRFDPWGNDTASREIAESMLTLMSL